MKFSKWLRFGLVSLICFSLVLMAACSNDSSQKADLGQINVYTRDIASGTREGFESIVGFKGELLDRANEVSSNGEMASQVASDPRGIGYVSLTTDFAKNKLKPLTYEGVEASVDNVNNSSYLLARPFAYCTRAKGDYPDQDKEALVAAFISFLTESEEGMNIVLSAGGIVDLSKAVPWSELKLKHPVVDQDNSQVQLVTAGSTSVEKTLLAALESFQAHAGNVQFKLAQTGSSDGWKRVLGSEKDGPNQADIGFASRFFKPEEDTGSAMYSGVYCQDAIVIVVSEEGPSLNNLSQADALAIYTGQITNWQDLEKNSK